MKAYRYILALLCSCTVFSCTDLDEKLYDQVDSKNFYNTKTDVIRAVFRPFEHAYWSVQPRHVLQELTADQVATWKKDDWWEDGGRWSRLHYHTWTIEEETFKTEWEACYQGIMQCNYIMDDLASLDCKTFGMTQEEFDALASQSKTLRAWFYLRLLDEFRNVPLAISSDASKNTESNVDAKTLFSFVESELKECVKLLPLKVGAAGNGMNQGQWTKAAAAALLVRLYLNAEVYIGEAKYDECAGYAKDIIDGKYGSYDVESTWDKVFDWDNENSNEIIF